MALKSTPTKVGMNFLQGACFNLAFVVCRQALEGWGYWRGEGDDDEDPRHRSSR
jgi:hypothetical protein